MSIVPQADESFVDYYELLGVSPDAEEATIARKIKDGQREWRARIAHTDLKRRQEAERRMALLAEARKTLLDAQKRARYDRTRKNRSTAAPRPTTSPEGYDPLERAEQCLAVNDYRQGAFFAEEAARTSNSAKAWNLRSRAYAGLGDGTRAIVAAQEAVALRPDDPLFHLDLGSAHMVLDEPGQAIAAFQAAAELSEEDIVPRGMIAGVHAATGDFQRAADVLSFLHREHPENEDIKTELAATYLAQAETVPSDSDGNSYTITSPDEIARMRQFVDKAAAVKSRDPEIRNGVEDMRANLDRHADRVVDFRAFSRARASGEMRVFLLAIHFLPFVLLYMVAGGIAVGDGQFTFYSMIGLLATVGIWWLYMVVPRWKQNRRTQKMLERLEAEGLL